MKFHKESRSFEYSTLLSTGRALVITILFALYNGYLGIRYHQAYPISICIYYIFLTLLRGIIAISMARIFKRKEKNPRLLEQRIHFLTSFLLILMNIVLSTPIALMVLNRKTVSFGLIAGITYAAYAFYKVTNAAVSLKKASKSHSLLVRELKNINLIDALVSIISLQNALIAIETEGSSNAALNTVTRFAGAAVMITAIVISIINLRMKNK